MRIHRSPFAPVRHTWYQTQQRWRRCLVGGELRRLSPMQSDLLALLLIASPARGMQTHEIIEALWPNPDRAPDFGDENIRVHIAALRRAGVLVENWFGSSYRIPIEGRAL
jgi:DNA-binding response OmpR family regulator